MSTRTDERPDLRTTDPSDQERFAHIVYSKGNAQALITEASVLGFPVEALCGKRWVPSRDPKRFPVCPECKEIADSLRGRGGEG